MTVENFDSCMPIVTGLADRLLENCIYIFCPYILAYFFIIMFTCIVCFVKKKERFSIEKHNMTNAL